MLPPAAPLRRSLHGLRRRRGSGCAARPPARTHTPCTGAARAQVVLSLLRWVCYTLIFLVMLLAVGSVCISKLPPPEGDPDRRLVIDQPIRVVARWHALSIVLWAVMLAMAVVLSVERVRPAAAGLPPLPAQAESGYAVLLASSPPASSPSVGDWPSRPRRPAAPACAGEL